MNKKYAALVVAMLIGMSFTSSYAKDMWLQNQGQGIVIMHVNYGEVPYTLKSGQNIKGLDWSGDTTFTWAYAWDAGEGHLEYEAGPYKDVSSFVVWDHGKFRVRGYRPKFLEPNHTEQIADSIAEGYEPIS